MTTEPIVFISHFTVKPGALDDLRRLWSDVAPRLEQGKPQTLAFLAYVDDAGTRLTIVHVFGSGPAMAAHFEGADERAATAYEFMAPAGWEIHGPAPAALVEGMRQAANRAGVDLEITPVALPGFLRLAAA